MIVELYDALKAAGAPEDKAQAAAKPGLPTRGNVFLSVKDSDKTVGQMITEKVAKIGENIQVRRFVRFKLGEGIEKRQDDFAAEVMAQASRG